MRVTILGPAYTSALVMQITGVTVIGEGGIAGTDGTVITTGIAGVTLHPTITIPTIVGALHPITTGVDITDIIRTPTITTVITTHVLHRSAIIMESTIPQ